MEISAAEFRNKCFQILDRVQKHHEDIVITKRGKPVAKLVHIEKENDKDPLLGVLAGMGKTVGDLTEPVGNPEDWELD